MRQFWAHFDLFHAFSHWEFARLFLICRNSFLVMREKSNSTPLQTQTHVLRYNLYGLCENCERSSAPTVVTHNGTFSSNSNTRKFLKKF